MKNLILLLAFVFTATLSFAANSTDDNKTKKEKTEVSFDVSYDMVVIAGVNDEGDNDRKDEISDVQAMVYCTLSCGVSGYIEASTWASLYSQLMYAEAYLC